MFQAIRRLIARVASPPRRGPVQHRPASTLLTAPARGPLPRARSPYGLPAAPFRADAVPLVRPYLVAYEREERRTALVLALDGVDVGPRVIHGIAVGGAPL